MTTSRKIATCCYCGTRAVLAFDKRRHELACSACGAPLHDMKFMPKPAENKVKKQPESRTSHSGWPAQAQGISRAFAERRPRPKPKKRKPFMRRVLEELWDEVEDIFD